MQSNEDRSAFVKMGHLEKVVTKGSKSSPDGISSLQPDPVYELEYSKPANARESRVVKEAIVGDIQRKENSSFAGSTVITRSQTSSQHNSTMDFLNIVNSFYTGRSNSEDKNVDSSESRQKSGKKSILPGNNCSCGAEDSWPQHKRRKVEGDLSDFLSASASLRVKLSLSFTGFLCSRKLDCVDDETKACLKYQCFSISQERFVAQSGVNKSLVCEMDQNEDYKMKVESQYSDKLQVDEVLDCLLHLKPFSTEKVCLTRTPLRSSFDCLRFQRRLTQCFH